jgi:16S rRNA processing protein RimM
VFLQSSGEEVGRVADVFDGTGTHDVMRIQLAHAQLQRLAAAGALQGSGEDSGSSGDEDGSGGSPAEGEGELPPHHVFLPFAKALVPVVDLEGGRMEVTPPPGLLELAAPSSMRRARRENRGRRDRRRQRPRARGEEGGDTASTEGTSGEE